MIASLTGRLKRKEPSRVVLQVGGVGYLVHIPFSTLFALGEEGSEASLEIYTHVREDALQLFGFATQLERQLFERLIGVTNIGPKMANTILSGIPAVELSLAIRAGDLRRLTAVPGLGKKTAERLVLELREKLDDLIPPSATAPQTPPGDVDRDDALSALVNLGWSRRDAEAALDRIDTADRPSLPLLLKRALAILAR